jgi:saccharopine dehydrogenase (NAD+, L-lysine forming)
MRRRDVKVLLIGVGGVGEAIAKIACSQPWLDQMVLADYDLQRSLQVQDRLAAMSGSSTNISSRFPIESVDASKQDQIEALARKYQVDLIMNAVDPLFNIPIFEAAYQYGCNYIDMAMTLSEPHPVHPYRLPGIKLGDYQFERAALWEEKGILALVAMGVEPGLSDVFAHYAADNLFETIDEIGVRDGANLKVEGYAFAPTFSIWTTIEECLNPPVLWDAKNGWQTTQPFSEPEMFEFPEGIGVQQCVNVEHEEVLLIPRWIKTEKVSFKYGLGEEFINVLKTLHLLNLDRKEAISVKGVKIAPRDVVAACLPNPAKLGDRMSGKTCAGTWVRGTCNGKPREIYLYQVTDNEECMRRLGVQAVLAQTGVNPVIAMELLATGLWKGQGVLGPEAFPAEPFLDRLKDYGFPYHIQERNAYPEPNNLILSC